MLRRRRHDEHAWSQQHLSHYVEDDLSSRARRRLELHAQECPECSRGIRSMRALLRLLYGTRERSGARAPASIFERVRLEAAQTPEDAEQADQA